MTPADLAELQRIVARLSDQDNRCTGEAAFYVQKVVPVFGIDPQWVDDPSDIRFGQEGECVDEAHCLEIETAYQDGMSQVTIGEDTYLISELDRYAVAHKWETVQVCFTEEGARAYLKADQHNISRDGEPRIFVESFHRNNEMITLRRILPELAMLAANAFNAFNVTTIKENQ